MLIRSLDNVKRIDRGGQMGFRCHRLTHVAAVLHSCLRLGVQSLEREERAVIAETLELGC